MRTGYKILAVGLWLACLCLWSDSSLALTPGRKKVVKNKLVESNRKIWSLDSSIPAFAKQDIAVEGLVNGVAELKALLKEARADYEEGNIDKAYDTMQEAESLYQRLYEHVETSQEVILLSERINGLKSVIDLYSRVGKTQYNATEIDRIEKEHAALLAGIRNGNFEIESAIDKLNREINKQYSSLDTKSPFRLPVRLGLSNTSFGRFGWAPEEFGEGLLINDLANFQMITKGYKQETKIRLTSDIYRTVINPVISDKKKDVTWVSYKREILLKGSDGKEYHWDYICSLLAPGIILKTDLPSISISQKRRRKYTPTHMIIPQQKGYKLIELEKDKEFVPEMSENWCLLLWSGKKNYTPVLLVLEKKPDSFEKAKRVFKIRNSKGIGHIGIVDYAGMMPFDEKEIDKWIENVPQKVLKKCKRLAQVMTEYPLKSKEYYAVDEAGREIFIRNEIEYYSIRDEWQTEKVKYAPLPPLLCFAEDKGYPVKILSKSIVDFDSPTKYGPYKAAEGNIVEYRVPLPDFNHMCYLKTDLDFGIKTGEAIQEKEPFLSYLKRVKNRMTKSESGMEIGSATRFSYILPAWNMLDEDVRMFLHKQNNICSFIGQTYDARKSFANTALIGGHHYADVMEPYTGKYYYTNLGHSRKLEKGLWQFCDTINGPGQWIFQTSYYYAKYSGDWQAIRERWGFFKRHFIVCTRQNDWALLAMSPVPHYAKTVHDGCLDGLKVPVCFMRMAKVMRDREAYLESAYIAAKHAVSVLVNHCLGEYMAQYDETVLRAKPDTYCLDLGIGENGCEIRQYGNCSWRDIVDEWRGAPGVWQGNLGLRFNMWTGVALSTETYDLHSQYFVESTRESVFKSIPQHLPDWYNPNRRHIHAIGKYMLARNVLGETTDDFLRHFKKSRFLAYNPALYPVVYSALQGRDAPCYLVSWEPNKLIHGAYTYKTNEAVIEIEAMHPGEVELKSWRIPAKISDNGKALSQKMWQYNKKRKLLDISLESQGRHIIKIAYPGWEKPVRPRQFPEFAKLPPALKPRPAVPSQRHPGSLGQGLLFYLDFEETAVASVAKGSSLPVVRPGDNIKYVSGIKGKGLKLDLDIDIRGGLLHYETDRNFLFEKGSFSYWVKPNHDPAVIPGIIDKVNEKLESMDKKLVQYFCPAFLKIKGNPFMDFGLSSHIIRSVYMFRVKTYETIKLAPSLATINFEKDKWTHVVCTWDGDSNKYSEMRFYCNGKLAKIFDCAQSETVYKMPKVIDYGSVNLDIGGYTLYPHNKEILQIVQQQKIAHSFDELRMYNRALSAKEVNDLYVFDRKGTEE